MEYKAKRPQKAWYIVILFVIIILAVFTCIISLNPAGIYVDWARFGVYGSLSGDANIISPGSYVITDRLLEPKDGSLVAVFSADGDGSYPEGMSSALIGTLVYRDGDYFISDESGIDIPVNEWQIEVISYCIKNVGFASMMLYEYRFIVWGVWVACLCVVISLYFTADNRYAAKNRRILIKTFDFYGEKFDNEEADSDY